MTEMDLSMVLLMHKQWIHEACQALKTLQWTEGYNADSSETKDAETVICVLTERCNNTMISFEKHTA